MNRREKLLFGLRRAELLGLEIGALNNPVALKSEGPVIYVDHFDTNALRTKYRDDASINVDAIVDVDAVWGAQTLAQCIGVHRKVDYVVASHVIEHVPDLITWLEEIGSILTSTGELRLAIPDRRFSFDYYRNETRFNDIVTAWILRARRPQPQQIADHMLNVAHIDTASAWREKPDPLNKRLLFEFAHLTGVENVIGDSIRNNAYHDVHCWVFTPASFAALMQDVVRAGLTDFGCSFFHDTAPSELEFTVAIKKTTDPNDAIHSWQTMRDSAKDLPPIQIRDQPTHTDTELLPSLIGDLRVVVPELKDAVGNLANLLSSRREAAASDAGAETLRVQLDLIKQSTSWRIMAPVRAAVDAVRRQRSGRASAK